MLTLFIDICQAKIAQEQKSDKKLMLDGKIIEQEKDRIKGKNRDESKGGPSEEKGTLPVGILQIEEDKGKRRGRRLRFEHRNLKTDDYIISAESTFYFW